MTIHECLANNKRLYNFNKVERLCNEIVIKKLISKGSTFSTPYFYAKVLKTDDNIICPTQILINVSKRNFKKAVDRNYIKRLIKEAYRKNKNTLYEFLSKNNIKLYIFVSYNTKEILKFQDIETKLQALIKKIINKYENIT